ncbi:hypothetical protein H6G64_36330 [Calothrix sp. FACHB-156]|nr:hypothetical protein [Calothrix sp. FACHB-156]
MKATNNVRDEFKKNFAFPIVLWINDDIRQKLIRLASDFNSWGGVPINFELPSVQLLELLKQTVDRVFAQGLFLKEFEPKALQQDLQSRGQLLEPTMQAGFDLLLGLAAYSEKEIDAALAYYEKSLKFWQQQLNEQQQGIVFWHIAKAHRWLAEQQENQTEWQAAKNAFQQAITKFEKSLRPDLASKAISQLGRVLQHMQDWDDLQTLAQKSVHLHKLHGTSAHLAEDYGFLAQVALTKMLWNEACQYAQQAIDILLHPLFLNSDTNSTIHIKNDEDLQNHTCGYYYYLHAQAQRELGKLEVAISSLDIAKNKVQPKYDAKLYINILECLRRLLYDQRQYLLAFQLKQEKRSIEQQYGLCAFIGAARLQAQQGKIIGGYEHKSVSTDNIETISKEITASGRQRDVKRLVEILSGDNCKLLVLHGQSGVGKSSIINAGLMVELKQKEIGIREVLPIYVRVYRNWVYEVGKELSVEIQEYPPIQPQVLIERLKQNERRNVLTVLIFDQFEEFFFADDTSQEKRQEFWEFLHICIKGREVEAVKIVLSLREDYLHYLLELERWIKAQEFTIVNDALNDILNKQNRYTLGNFSVQDTEAVISSLSEGTQFQLEAILIKELVKDLAGNLGEIRPIELQIVGAQLQVENITTLVQYKEKGPKEELVKRYLAQVIEDCGSDNYQLATLILYLLTDEKQNRPLKIRAELERDIKSLATELTIETTRLDLILEILVGSGLVFLFPEIPANRYQLVHDYLAKLIRSQQETQLTKLLIEEKEQRQKAERELIRVSRRQIQLAKGSLIVLAIFSIIAVIFGFTAEQQRKVAIATKESQINSISGYSKALYKLNQNWEALVEGLRATQELNLVPTGYDTRIRASVALQQALTRIAERNRLEGHMARVTSVQFSPDGKTIASASIDKTIRLWNLKGQEIGQLGEKIDYIYSIKFSPNGKMLASAGQDNIIRLWALDGQLLKTFEGHKKEVIDISFSPNGQILASTSADQTVKLWSMEGKLLKTFTGHISENSENNVNSVSISYDNKMIVSADESGKILLWSTNGKILKTLQHSGGVNSVRFSRDGKFLVSAGRDKKINLWSLDGTLLKTLTGHEGDVKTVEFSLDGNIIISGSDDQKIKIWSITGELLETFVGHTGSVISVSPSPDKNIIVSGSADNTIRLWDLYKLGLRTLKRHDDVVNSISFSLDGTTLVTASADGAVKLWNLYGQELDTFKKREVPINSVSFSPKNNGIFAFGSEDGTISIWDKKQLKELASWEGHTGDVYSIQFSPNGETITSGGKDGTVKLWSLNGGEIKTIRRNGKPVFAISFSPDGKIIAAAGADKNVELWSLQGQQLFTLKGHRENIFSIQFSPDGQTIASGSEDGIIKLWRLDGQEIKTIHAHTGNVMSISFSPEGKIIASGGFDKTVKLWNLEGKEIGSYYGHKDLISSLSFSKNRVKPMLASASADKTVIFWTLDLEYLQLRSCDWLKDYFTNHLREKAEFKICSKEPNSIEAGLLRFFKGEDFARQGNIENALIEFRGALRLNPELSFNPENLARQLVGSSLIEQGNYLAKQGEVKQAISLYEKAEKTDLSLEISASSWNDLCLAGILNQEPVVLIRKTTKVLAGEALSACNKAVSKEPDDGIWHSNRGVAKTKTGNFAGAIEDFKAFIAWTKTHEIQTTSEANMLEKARLQRQQWIRTLHEGKDPFTDREILYISNERL